MLEIGDRVIYNGNTDCCTIFKRLVMELCLTKGEVYTITDIFEHSYYNSTYCFIEGHVTQFPIQAFDLENLSEKYGLK